MPARTGTVGPPPMGHNIYVLFLSLWLPSRLRQVASWYNCKGAGAGQCATQLNVQTPLPYDVTPASVTIGGTAYAMTPGTQVSLSQGEAAIVYLLNAGNIGPIDAGNTYALQIQAGQASSVTQVSVEQK